MKHRGHTINFDFRNRISGNWGKRVFSRIFRNTRTDTKFSGGPKRLKKRRSFRSSNLETIRALNGEDIVYPRLNSCPGDSWRLSRNDIRKPLSPESGFEESNYLESTTSVNQCVDQFSDEFNRSLDVTYRKSRLLLPSFQEKSGEGEDEMISDSSTASSSLS